MYIFFLNVCIYAKFAVLGLMQTGDESPYYKRITLEGRVFLKSSPVRSRAIHCVSRKSCFCKLSLIIGAVRDVHCNCKAQTNTVRFRELTCLITGGETPPLRDV